ncbi:MAG TPA: glycosyltransferase, partial [Flavitalea sp.]|nr:glycosyltransferase [Flavitalea sp.]
EREVIPALNGVVFVSEFMKRRIQDYLGTEFPANVACIPCFTSKPVSSGNKGPANDLISIGTLETRKNHAYILRVLSIAKSKGQAFTLTLVGDGPERNTLERLAKQLGIDGQVHFVGAQSNGASFIPGHKVYVHSALIENLPISLLEAQSCGLPIIAPAVGGIPEIITDGNEGFFWPLNDPEAGASTLSDLILNQSLFDAVAHAAAEKFKSKFDTGIVVSQLQQFWKT